MTNLKGNRNEKNNLVLPRQLKHKSCKFERPNTDSILMFSFVGLVKKWHLTDNIKLICPEKTSIKRKMNFKIFTFLTSNKTVTFDKKLEPKQVNDWQDYIESVRWIFAQLQEFHMHHLIEYQSPSQASNRLLSKTLCFNEFQLKKNKIWQLLSHTSRF